MEYMESVKKLEEKMLLNQQKQESNGFFHDKYTGEGPGASVAEEVYEIRKLLQNEIHMRKAVEEELNKLKSQLGLYTQSRVLSGKFLRSYGKDIINIHHGLLPSFKGGKPSKQVERVSHRDNLQTFVQKSEDVEKRCLAKAIKSYCELRVLPYEMNKTVVF